MKIGILTYPRPHRKTQDLMLALKCQGYEDVFIEEVEWRDDIKPFKSLIQPLHHKAKAIDTSVLPQRLGYKAVNDLNDQGVDYILIGGTQLIDPREYEAPIINAHPGYLPYVRGLDALKWSILEGHPIGVTTHIIDDKIDCGFLIDRQIIAQTPTDTIHSLAQKQYELEIEMLAGVFKNDISYDRALPDSHPSHRRMSHDKELLVLKKLSKNTIF